MHVTIVSIGSRGDVQPFIALSLGLMEKGHTVTLATTENFKIFTESFGIAFHPLPANTEEVITSPEGERLLQTAGSLDLLKFFRDAARPSRYGMWEQLMQCCAAADLILTSYISIYPVSIIAEKLQKRWAVVNLNPPLIPSSERPVVGLDFISFSWYNRLTYPLVHYLEWHINRKEIAELRALLELPASSKSYHRVIAENKIPVLHAISPHLFRRPADWPSHAYMSGFLTLPDKQQQTPDKTPEELEDWLQAGEKPVYIGFGSIPFPDKKLLMTMLQELLVTTSCRILFCKGWTQIDNLPRDARFFVVSSVHHASLFPKCAAAVIHGGVGTLTAVLRSGIPLVVVSIFADQPFWGKVMQERKLGAHVPWKKVTASRLKNAIKEASSKPYQHNAQMVALQLKGENGVENVVTILEKHFRSVS